MASTPASRPRRRTRRRDVDGLIVVWYTWLGGLTQAPVFALRDLADGLAFPLASAVLFGLIGALSPCQLTTNLGALAYASARAGEARPLALAGAYVAGKVSVYALVGAAVVLAGLQLQTVSIPVVTTARKGLGPLMLLIGLALLGVWRPRLAAGQRIAARLRERLGASGIAGAYLLGVAFAFAFCPTLFLLFFGLTIPLALRSAGGWAFPGLFALGSSLPLLAVTMMVAGGTGAAAKIQGSARRLEQPLRLGAAFVLV